MTVWKPDNENARILIDTCLQILDGKTPSTVNGSINNGLKDVPSVLVLPVTVDKNNMDSTIIAAGYYPKEDVYATPEN
jgi:D-xylose transport system substrate-binding protein